MTGWADRSIRNNLMAGGALLVLLVGGVGGWAATTELAGAVIASGSLVVDSNVKKVQHPTGGVVGELLVHDGDKVNAGDVVLRLDDTITRANLAIVSKALDEQTARKARLEAERDGDDNIVFPQALLDRQEQPDVRRVLTGERRLFESRRSARTGQKSQLQQRIVQMNEEIAGQIAQAESKAKEVVLIERELEGVRDLWQKNLVQLTRLTALEREATRIAGERAQLGASTASARGKIAEIELQIIQIDSELISDVSKDMRETDAKIGEYVERKITAEDQLKRIDLRAPQDGFVHQLAVHTVGGVVTANDAVMLIVPSAERLVVEIKVNPQDIDQVHVGQQAGLRFTTFSQRTTPEINGTVSRVSADVTADQRSGASYYTVRVAVPPDEIARLGDVQLVPGMPVEAFVRTTDRSVMSYLVRPLKDQIARAFREK
jgi:HlyD family secretion protein